MTNMKHITTILCSIPFFLSILSCGHKENGNPMDEQTDIDIETEVDTMRLKHTTFHVQLVCNGKLEAQIRSQIAFPSQGIVTGIYVQNGSKVRKGDLLAVTEKKEKEEELDKRKKDLEKANIDLSDKLIGLGYDADGKGVPVNVMNREKITSGQYLAEYQLSVARKALSDCELRAPFSGRVADMACQLYQRADKFGLLIDDSFFEVEFNVLEAELKSISLGQQVLVSPFADLDKTFNGQIVRINPTVDSDGLVKVEARIRNTDPMLIDGMNVRVVVEKDVPNKMVVPKSAVVERDGYHVVFAVKDSIAIWTYVDVEHTNLDSYAITGCHAKNTSLKEGEIIVVSNNQSMADGTKVRIRKREDR